MPNAWLSQGASKTSSPFLLGRAAEPPMSATSRSAFARPRLISRGGPLRGVLLRPAAFGGRRDASPRSLFMVSFSYGVRGSPTPIMESRVTRAASSSSDNPSVPSGRSGSTKYRISALLSHTRTSTASSMSRPNSSFNTLRGSITARERYWGYLYQLGGNPSTGQG